MLKAFYYLLLRDMRLALRSRHELANPLIFFVLVVTLSPLAVMPTPERLQEMAPGVMPVRTRSLRIARSSRLLNTSRRSISSQIAGSSRRLQRVSMDND